MEHVIAFLRSEPELAGALTALASTLTAIVALLLSLLSLFVSERALRHQRRHNVLSVAPLPSLVVSDYENLLKVRVSNNGPGPLIITAVEITGDGEPSDSLVKKMPDLPSGRTWTHFFGSVRTSFSVRPGGDLVLLQLEGDSDDAEFADARDAVRNALVPLTLTVEYTDIYGTAFRPASRDLSWFGRHSPSSPS